MPRICASRSYHAVETGLEHVAHHQAEPPASEARIADRYRDPGDAIAARSDVETGREASICRECQAASMVIYRALRHPRPLHAARPGSTGMFCHGHR